MIQRTLELVVFTGVGSGLALSYFPSGWSASLGAVGGAVAWAVLDNWRAARVLRWLREAEPALAPDVSSVWGEVVERARKSFKGLSRQARKSEARLQAFLAAMQASPNGVLLLDKGGTIEWCNLTAAQHFSLDPQRDVGQQVRNLVRDPAFSAYWMAGDFQQGVEIDGREATPGHPHRIHLQIHPYGGGRKLMLSRDVTSVALAEAMRRDFVANVSHEIRTPLTVVSGFIETMQNLDLAPEERQHFLGLMQQQAQRMQTLVNDLLTLSRLEGSPAPAVTDWGPGQALLEQAVAEAKGLSEVLVGGQQRLDVLVSPPGLDIAGSRSELLSAMSNLLSNAVRYTPAGGVITTGWRRLTDGGAEFFVTDTGPGIEAEHLPRLTERFYRVDRSRSRETGGTGLGLAIVKHVAQRHGGQMAVESTVGQGSTFRICLPAARVRWPAG